jgi:voltage-gated potassium channel
MFVKFSIHFLRVLWHFRSVNLAILALLIVGALGIASVEEMPIGKALYFAFVTGLTIGYGDIVATTVIGRIISVLLGFVGIIFTGLVVAAAARAVQEGREVQDDPG